MGKKVFVSSGVMRAHKGFAAFEIETAGRAAHGPRPDLGVDAITAMGPVLVEIAALDARLQTGPRHPVLGTGNSHASLVEGGHEASSYPARCRLTGEWRTVRGDDPESALLDSLKRAGSPAELRMTYAGDPFSADSTSAIVQVVERETESELVGVAYWADSALLAAAGIPTVLFGPAGGGAYGTDEWVDVSSVERVRNVLVGVARSSVAPSATTLPNDVSARNALRWLRRRSLASHDYSRRG